MRTKRPISINNSLSHGICNYNCKLCGVNKPSYKGPKEFQPEDVTRKLIARIEDAGRSGLRVRYIANAGDGEPTLHPDFGKRMDMFGRMVKNWNIDGMPAPEVSVVTNGGNLHKKEILDVFARNPLTLIVSFPTCDSKAYGELMMCNAHRGEALMKKAVSGLELAMKLHGQGKIDDLYIHVSPPEREVVRRDFVKTMDFLTERAAAAGIKKLKLVLFPATSNRSGLIKNKIKGCDMYRDMFRKHHGSIVNGVKIEMTLSFKRFFPRFTEFIDLLRSFNYPCTWNSQLFVTAAGDSICCNDQAVRNPMGNVLTSSLMDIFEMKEDYLPGRVCAGCDQAPKYMNGSFLSVLFGKLACAKLAWAKRKGGCWSCAEKNGLRAGQCEAPESVRIKA